MHNPWIVLSGELECERSIDEFTDDCGTLDVVRTHSAFS